MILVIDNHDIDNPDATKTASPVALDLGALSLEEPPPRQFAPAIAAGVEALEKKANLKKVQTLANEGFKAFVAVLEAEHGVPVGYSAPYAYYPKPKAIYDLWKRVVQLFALKPETLDMTPKVLAAYLNEQDQGYVVMPSMFHDKLNNFAAAGAGRLLASLGPTIRLHKPVSIRSIQRQLAAFRASSSEPADERFSGRFVIRDDACHVNGVAYKVDVRPSGDRRIKFGGRWLPLDVLKAVCAAD